MPHTPSFSPLGMPFIGVKSVDSTNNYALARAHAGLAQHGEAIFAHEQVAGKGRMGKVWTSGKDENIILSIVANPHPLQLTQQFQLSATVAVGVHDLFAKYAGDNTKIKWPNDLYWQDRKAGGILIESIVGKQELGVGSSESGVGPANTQWKWAVIGTGININQTLFPDTLINPVSLKQITGKSFDVIELAKELCATINNRFSELMSGGFESIYEQYISRLYKRNETVKLKKGSRVFEATIKTVSTAGRLVVQHSIEDEFDVGEIEWVK